MSSLLVADDSLMMVIDAQTAFLDKLPAAVGGQLLSRICWLTQLAIWRHVPLLVTAEDLASQPVAPALCQVLPHDLPVYDKRVFGLAGQPDILEAVQRTGRRTAILIGLETDVCITHSALGLLDRGHRVAVVEDAVGSPEDGQRIGLARMQRAGVVLVSMKSLFYEWLRTLAEVDRFHREMPDMEARAGEML